MRLTECMDFTLTVYSHLYSPSLPFRSLVYDQLLLTHSGIVCKWTIRVALRGIFQYDVRNNNQKHIIRNRNTGKMKNNKLLAHYPEICLSNWYLCSLRNLNFWRWNNIDLRQMNMWESWNTFLLLGTKYELASSVNR